MCRGWEVGRGKGAKRGKKDNHFARGSANRNDEIFSENFNSKEKTRGTSTPVKAKRWERYIMETAIYVRVSTQ